MSYIPDYRSQTDKLNAMDKAYITGFRFAVDMVKNALNNVDDGNLLSIEKEIIAKLSRTLDGYLKSGEKMLVCHLFDSDEYSDIELNDEHPMFNTKRKDNEE